MLLGLKRERVHIDALAGHVLVMLVRLHQVEVTSLALGEAIVAVKLELTNGHGVGTVVEGHWDVHLVSTTGGHTGHGAGGHVAGRGQDGTVGTHPWADGRHVALIVGIGVVEWLLAVGGRVSHVVIGLYNPN